MRLAPPLLAGLFCGLVAHGSGLPSLPVECHESVEPEEESSCIAAHEVCTMDEKGCCEGLSCIGFGFYKKCTEPPVCLSSWQQCNGDVPCCSELKCVIRENGNKECDKEQIGTPTLEFTGASLVAATASPTGAPKTSSNLVTTHPPPGTKVEYKIASSSGDPHITTFDGIKYDCQAEGEVILAKSLVTRRQVQARYKHMSSNKAISQGAGVAIQDEGDTPLVEISVASLPETVGNKMDECSLLLFIDGVQKDLFQGFEDEKVVVKAVQSKITVTYRITGMETTINYSRCRMNISLKLPLTDVTYGVLGTPNGNSKDEWTTLSGDIFEPVSRADSLRKAGYDFCAVHFCLRDEEQSLFTYAEPGMDFDSYNRCDLPYGDTLEKFVNDIPQWVVDACGSDLQCIIDVRNGGADEARMLQLARMEVAQVCNPTGGECEESRCCGGVKCVDFGGNAGKFCGGDMTCSPEFGNCATLACCDDMSCVELNDGSMQCRKELVCQEEWMSCKSNSDCCSGTVCLDNQAKGLKQCRKLPTCMKNLDDCSLVGCCGSLKCTTLSNGGKQCQDQPGCWKQQWKDCSITPCCDGLTCIKEIDGRNVCKQLPKCAKLGTSCQHIPCCESNEGPTNCFEVTDAQGNTGKQCRLVPGDIEVKVFHDINGNGVFDADEPGIENVKLAIFEEINKQGVQRAKISDDRLTNADGIVTFQSMPKGKDLRVSVVEAPPGAIPTRKTPSGADKDIDSNLRSDGTSDIFKQIGTKYTATMLGYRLPRDVEVRVFNDANANGVQDEGEVGIRGVYLRLVQSNYTDFADMGTGGNAHEELATDDNGLVQFQKVPQDVSMRVEVTKKPEGAIPTVKDKGGEDKDSDLNSNGFTDTFKVEAGSGTHAQTDIGYRMPESVIVRVWDDVNRNGIQDMAEKGIANVPLQLVLSDKVTPLSAVGNDGTAHLTLNSDADGTVTFTAVPINIDLRIKVVQMPTGAIPTLVNKGGDESVDSDLNSDLSTDTFRLSGGGAFTARDIGISMPGSVIVRVWDDADGDGIQDADEKGIPGATLQLVGAETLASLQNTGGNAHLSQDTDKDGYVVFTGVPQNVNIRCSVVNSPPGAIPTSKGGGDEDTDSDLNNNGLSDSFRLVGFNFTEIDLGYKMPDVVEVRVWDDDNEDGIQDEGEAGIEGVEVRLVNTDRQDLAVQPQGNAHEVLTTDANGIAQFTMVPKGVALRVKVVNRPPGAIETSKRAGGDINKDSDLNSDSFSDSFDLRNFNGGVFGSIDLGYRMPETLEINVWDDMNANGLQDTGEPGIPGVVLKLVKADKTDIDTIIEGGTAHQEITSGPDGVVRFLKVPKSLSIRALVVGPPPGAKPTSKNQGGNDMMDSDLNGDLYSDTFQMTSFRGAGALGMLDLGFQMPADMIVRVWDDVDGDGIQGDREPGIKGVELSMVLNDKVTPLPNSGGGSNAHLTKFTDENGFATFGGVPRTAIVRIKVANAPPGSVATQRNKGTNDHADSDMGSDLVTDSFDMNNFKGVGAVGQMDLGFRMPKTVVVRVWRDADSDGIQDELESGFEGIRVQLLNATTRLPLPEQGNGGTAHQILTTGSDGRVRFTLVPQSTSIRIRVLNPPAGFRVSLKDRGTDEQLDSDLNSDHMTDPFTLPSDVTEMFDMRDCGYRPV